MDQREINEMALAAERRAEKVLKESGIAEVWEMAGCRVNIVGSLRMGLIASHRDIDLHVYSGGVTEEHSFSVAAKIARIPGVEEIRCINGLRGEEHCIAWHIFYKYDEELWQFDVIHIEEGTEFDGYFERMADRIVAVMTREQRDTILRLKFETPAGCDYHGVEYYEAVIADGVRNQAELDVWVAAHRRKAPYYWMP